MKKITTEAGVFGPYVDIKVLPDRYRCDGSDLPFVVVGQGDVSEVMEGDFPPPPLQPEPVPTSVTMRQARLQLLAIGRLAEVDVAVSQMGTEAQIVWDYSSVVERNHALITPMQQLLGYTDAQMDELFIAASKL